MVFFNKARARRVLSNTKVFLGGVQKGLEYGVKGVQIAGIFSPSIRTALKDATPLIDKVNHGINASQIVARNIEKQFF